MGEIIKNVFRVFALNNSISFSIRYVILLLIVLYCIVILYCIVSYCIIMKNKLNARCSYICYSRNLASLSKNKHFEIDSTISLTILCCYYFRICYCHCSKKRHFSVRALWRNNNITFKFIIWTKWLLARWNRRTVFKVINFRLG